MEHLPADQILRCQKGSDSFEGVTAFVALSASLIYSQEAEQKRQLTILFLGADWLNYMQVSISLHHYRK